MRIRSTLIGVLVIAAVTPLAVTASASAASRPAAQTLIPTHVDIRSIGSSPITYGRSILIRGQVIYTDPEDGKQYGAEGTVTLDRRFTAGTTWVTVGSDDMSVFYPVFSFSTTVTKNAEYRVSFLGSDRYQPSTGSVTARVARDVIAKLTEPRENVFYFSGRVRPAYAGRSITLMRKKCSSCAWQGYATQKTSATSQYRFRLPLPNSGTHYFRTRVLGNADFVTSFSSTYQLIRLL